MTPLADLLSDLFIFCMVGGFKFFNWPCSFSLVLGNFTAKSNIGNLALVAVKGFNAWFEV